MHKDILTLFKRLQIALHQGGLENVYLKPKQIICLESLFLHIDVVAVLPTGYGKSMIFQLLPFFLPQKTSRNIVIVVSPLSSIIEDQIKILRNRGIVVNVLSTHCHKEEEVDLFNNDIDKNEPNYWGVSVDVWSGALDILFTHPEDLLSESGRKLMNSGVFQKNVVAYVVDEAHCIEGW